MFRSHALRALRLPLLLIAVLALVWIGLMSVEQTSSHPAGLKATNSAAQQPAAKPKPADKPPKQCKDKDDKHGEGGKGDKDHGKHCRGVSDD